MDNYFMKWHAEKERADMLESVLLSFLTEKELKRSEHMHHLEEKNKKLKHEIRVMQEKAEEFNRLNYATGLIVNCTGCEGGAPFDSENLTEEKVKTVEMIAKRLRSWWNGHCYREMQKLAKGDKDENK